MGIRAPCIRWVDGAPRFKGRDCTAMERRDWPEYPNQNKAKRARALAPSKHAWHSSEPGTPHSIQPPKYLGQQHTPTIVCSGILPQLQSCFIEKVSFTKLLHCSSLRFPTCKQQWRCDLDRVSPWGLPLGLQRRGRPRSRLPALRSKSSASPRGTRSTGSMNTWRRSSPRTRCTILRKWSPRRDH